MSNGRNRGRSFEETVQEPETVPATPASDAPLETAVDDHSDVEPDPRAGAVRALVQKWVSDCIHSTPVSQNTETYNHLTSVLPALEALILKEINNVAE